MHLATPPLQHLFGNDEVGDVLDHVVLVDHVVKREVDSDLSMMYIVLIAAGVAILVIVLCCCCCCY